MKHHNYADARKYFMRSLLLNSNDNPSIHGFCQAESHLPRQVVDAVGENVFCVLKNKDELQYIAIHETGVMEDIVSPNTFANYSHYSVQDPRIASMLFAAQGDTIVLCGEEYEITEVMSANDAIMRFYFSTLSAQKGVITISSANPEELRDEISLVLKKSSEELSKTIAVYNQLEIRSPLTILSSTTGKGMLITCEFLAYENQERIRNNLSVVEPTDDALTYVLSYEIIVYLTHLDMDGNQLKDLNMVCSQPVRNQLLNDIAEELSVVTDDKQKAMMFYENGKLSLLERTSDMRRNRHLFLTRLKSLVESLHTISNASVFTSRDESLKAEIESLFSREHLLCEGSTLSAVQNTKNAVLVTDDQFLYAVANTEGLPNMGLTGLLSQSNLPWDSLLAVSKKLKDMNYLNYLPVPLYKQIVNQVLDKGVATKDASAEIQAWIASDTDDTPSANHEDIIIALFRDVVTQKLDYLNPNDFLTDIVFDILKKRDPDFIKKSLTDAVALFKSTVQERIM